MEIKTIHIVGSGTMGTGIAYAAAQNMFQVKMLWRSEATRDRSVSALTKMRNKAVERGLMTADASDELWNRIEFVNDLKHFSDSQLVIESVVEKEDIKQDILKQINAIVDDKAIIATNTSSISITALASKVNNPARFIGMHFFNPVYAMRLVEIIRGFHTSDETVETVRGIASRLKKTSIVVQRDTPGFVVNRLFMAQVREALKVLEEGIASAEDIDTALQLGLNHPMGPFRLMDNDGVDIAYFVMEHLRKQMGDAYMAPQILKRMVEAGCLGKKTGRGFYDYSK